MKLRISEEVAEALRAQRGVVALETSVVAQGLPRPHNAQCARACEAAVRRAGAVPATVALVDGEVRVGITDEELERLAAGDPALLKVGSRDLAFALATGRSGGTTVSATCEISAAAGIRVFATGGIGGVHRGASEHFDISQDLGALARFPVATVCAGAKSVLDLPKTLEVLETLGVPVVGFGTDQFPSFYSRSSGLPLEHVVVDAKAAARLMRARFEHAGQGGLLFAQPPPAHAAIAADEVEGWIAEALQAARAQGVVGKRVTPFLLGELVRRSGGRTLGTNIALLESNASLAGAIAVEYAAGAAE